MKDIGFQIVVLDGGFVYVGRVKMTDGFVLLTEAKNIRRWGTSKGLGELVNGPTKETVADPAGDLIIPLERVIFFHQTKEWK